MTQLLFLGSGSAFTVGADNYHSNMLLTDDEGHRFLIDCGSDIRFSLHAMGFSYRDITDIYISHLHADHVGGMEYIGLSTKFDPACAKPRLYLSKDIAGEIWENSLAAGMRCSSDRDIADLSDYFDVHAIGVADRYFYWQNIKFDLVRVIHIYNGFYLMPSYGLYFEIEGVKIFLTTDTQLCLDQLQPFYDKADLIFQDCEILPIPTTVHASFEKLIELPAAIKKKMWLYGYQPVKLPNACDYGFLGFVKRGQIFEFN
jgi:ribonuclease BN (tRNA processing enzyme)